MNSHSLNTFIINNNPTMVTQIRDHLTRRFGNVLKIYTYRSGRTALQEIDANTRIVILDNCLDGESEDDVKKSIKLKNPDTEVITLTSSEDIANAVGNYCEMTPSKRQRKQMSAQLSHRIYKIVSYPIYLLVREFGVSKFVAIFLLAWLTIGIVTVIALSIVL